MAFIPSHIKLLLKEMKKSNNNNLIKRDHKAIGRGTIMGKFNLKTFHNSFHFLV